MTVKQRSREPLSRARILDHAVRMADRDGLQAVTLRRLAAELGVHVTSLYNHVATKEAVIDGIVENLILEAKLPSGEVRWQDWVRQFADAMRTLASTHPGAVFAFQQRPVQGPAAAATFEAALEALSRAGLSAIDAYGCVKAVSVAVLGFTAEESLRAGGSEPQTELAALPVEDFPVLHAVGAAAYEADTWGVLTEILLAGIRARIRAARRASA